MKKLLLLIFFGILFIHSVSAIVTCTSIEDLSYESGTSVVQTRSFECTNSLESPQVTLTKGGTGSDYFELSETIIGQSSNTTETVKTFTLDFDENAPQGMYSGRIQFSDDSPSISFIIEIIGVPQGCIIDVFPTTLSNVKVKQGETKTRNIQFSVPSCYENPVSINGVTLQTDERPIQLGELNLGILQPGSSLLLPIEIDAVDVATGQYADIMQFLVYDENGDRISVPSVSISVFVSQSISPVDDTTFSTPPSCTLSSINLNPNETYTFSCSGVVANLDIEIESSEYFRGNSVEVSSGFYTYHFTPLKNGEFVFTAEFKYEGAPIFSPFEQDVRITSTGITNPGTNLALGFTPSLSEAQGGGAILIQVVDNETGSLVEGARLWVNAIEINSSQDTFEYNLEVDIDYEIRAKAVGYDDILQTITISPRPITISITPTTGSTSTLFNITTNPINASLFVNDVKIENPYYSTLSAGENVIKAIFKGYQTKEINFSVSAYAFIESGCSTENFKKNVAQICVLSDYVNYTVTYRKDPTKELQQILNGTGDTIEFTPEDSGLYYINADGRQVLEREIKGGFWKAKWWFMYWWLWFLIPILIVVMILIVRSVRSVNPIDSTTPYS